MRSRYQGRRRPACRLGVEALEGRLLLSGDMVLRWNAIMLAAVRNSGQGSQPDARFAIRTGAIVQAAVYDAVNSIDQSYTPYLALVPAPAGASEDAAAAQAAHDTLVAILAARAHDGSNNTVAYNVIYQPGAWQLTPPAYGLPLSPQW